MWSVVHILYIRSGVLTTTIKKFSERFEQNEIKFGFRFQDYLVIHFQVIRLCVYTGVIPIYKLFFREYFKKCVNIVCSVNLAPDN